MRLILNKEMVEEYGPQVDYWGGWPVKTLVSSIISSGLVAVMMTAMAGFLFK